MIFPTVKVVYNRRKTATATRAASIEIDVSYRSRHRYVSTGISVLPSEWSEAGCMVVNNANSYFMNFEIAKKLTEVKEHINLIMVRGEEFTLSALKYEGKRAKVNGSFIEYIENKIDERRDIRDSTRKTQRKIVTKLRSFGYIEQFSDISYKRLKEFDNWLHASYDNQATIHSYHKFLKIYINMAIADGLLKENPYKTMKISRGGGGARRFLNDAELKAVAAVNVEDRSVMRARDLFLFQCYTGLAYSDLMLYDFTKIERQGDKYILNKRRQKTGVGYYVVLLPPAVEILERYKFKLPTISNQKYNDRLKSVAAFAGLKFNLTSHCGRHTFATWCLNNGVPLDTLRTMLGHTDPRTTALYAKMLNKTVESAFEMLETKINSLN